MISNDRPPYGNRPYGGYLPSRRCRKTRCERKKIQIERKTFVMTLRENPRGAFSFGSPRTWGGRRDTIIIPSTGFGGFQEGSR